MNLQIICWVKNTNPKGYIIYNSIYVTFLKSQKYRIRKYTRERQKRKETGISVIIKRKYEISLCSGNTLCFDSIDINILVLISYCGFMRYYHWGKLGQWHIGSLCFISDNSMWIYNQLKIVNWTEKNHRT